MALWIVTSALYRTQCVASEDRGSVGQCGKVEKRRGQNVLHSSECAVDVLVGDNLKLPIIHCSSQDMRECEREQVIWHCQKTTAVEGAIYYVGH